MKLYHIYNTETFEVSAGYFETEPLNAINHVINGQIKPIYDVENDNIIEGATPKEIITTLINRINTAFTKLRQRALASSIGKPLAFGFDYIKEQSEQYRDKYHVAKGTIVNAVVSQMIADESNDFGITEEEMKAMIVQRFEAGENAYLQFTAMIERGRTKALTFVENNDFHKAEIVISIMESVPETLTMEVAILLSNSLIQV
jgi:hypothetical protein